MKFLCATLMFLLLPLAAVAQEAAAPELRISAIEERFLGGDRGGASSEVKAWMKSDQKAPWPWLASARLRFHEKRYKKCISEAGEALEREPQNADAYYWRGRCFEAQGKTLDASNEYRAALKAAAAHPEAQEALSRIQPGLGATAER